MFAYVVTASFPAYGPARFRMLIYSNGDKNIARAIAEKCGWVVKKIAQADWDDISELKDYREVLRWVREECRRQSDVRAKQAALAEEQRRWQAEWQRREEERQRQEREDRRQTAIARVVGDLLAIDPEPSAEDNSTVAEICSKVLLFFDGSAVNKVEVYTSISLDYARFRANAKSLPRTAKILQQVIHDLNSFLAIESKIAESQHRVQIERQSAEGKINSIASRTHVFGGSGEGLFISAILADLAVARDRKDARAIASQQDQIERDFVRAYKLARTRQRILEVRARTAILIVMPSMNIISGVSIPEDIEALAALVGHEPRD